MTSLGRCQLVLALGLTAACARTCETPKHTAAHLSVVELASSKVATSWSASRRYIVQLSYLDVDRCTALTSHCLHSGANNRSSVLDVRPRTLEPSSRSSSGHLALLVDWEPLLADEQTCAAMLFSATLQRHGGDCLYNATLLLPHSGTTNTVPSTSLRIKDDPLVEVAPGSVPRELQSTGTVCREGRGDCTCSDCDICCSFLTRHCHSFAA